MKQDYWKNVELAEKGVQNIIIVLKAKKSEPNDIFQVIRDAYKGKLTDEEIQQMIDDVEENE